MIKRIVSGGQTGADRAALDFSIKFGIPHGGWIPKGRLAEDGPLPEEYQLEELPTGSHPALTEKNVVDSDGTLIFSRGRPTGDTDYARKMVLKHGKQLLHVDLSSTAAFAAASLILSWIEMQHIKIMNVAGPRASKDSDIYGDVFKVLSTAYMLHAGSHAPLVETTPQTVQEAVDRLVSRLPLRDKSRIANMTEDELPTLHHTLGSIISSEFGTHQGNQALLHSCEDVSGDKPVHPAFAPPIIIRELWKRLRKTHRLRVVE